MKTASVPSLWLLTFLLAGCHPAPSRDVIATVNGHPVWRADLEKAYSESLSGEQSQERASADQANSVRI